MLVGSVHHRRRLLHAPELSSPELSDMENLIIIFLHSHFRFNFPVVVNN